MQLSNEAKALLKEIKAKWPDPLTVAPETEFLSELRAAALVEQWDMHPNGDRRWIVTKAGRELP